MCILLFLDVGEGGSSDSKHQPFNKFLFTIDYHICQPIFIVQHGSLCNIIGSLGQPCFIVEIEWF